MKKNLTLLLLLILVLKTEAQSSVFNLVDSLLLNGNYEKALILLENTEPKTFSVYEKTAGIYHTIGSDTKALANLQKAIKIDSSKAVKMKLAQLYVSSGLISKAIETYETIIKKDTSNLLAANNLGKLYLAQNKAVKAEEIYRFLKQKDSLNPNYPFQIAEALLAQNKKLAMGQSYLDAYKLDTLSLKSMYELAKFFKSLQIRDSSMLFIEKGLKIDSLNINFLQLKANELYFSKQYNEAINSLKKLDSLNFKSAATYEMFGMCYYNLKDFELAEIHFKNALKLDRENPKIYYRLATLYYDQKKYEVAKLYLSQSITKAKPDLDKQYFLFGIIEKETENFTRAIYYFDEAYKNNRDNYKALFELGTTSDMYFEDKKIAYKHYSNYIKIFENKDVVMTNYAKQRIQEIKKELFIEGEIID